MSRERKEIAWVDGVEELRIAEQYAGRPQDGLVFTVRQRTTGAGRTVLLTPKRVREVEQWLATWLDGEIERWLATWLDTP